MGISLYRREGTHNWWVRYVDNDGKLCRLSTGTPDKAQAQSIANQIEESLAIDALPDTDQFTDGRDDGQCSAGAFDEPETDLRTQIDRLEVLLLSALRFQTQAQEISAKRMASILRLLDTRTRRLERAVDPTVCSARRND